MWLYVCKQIYVSSGYDFFSTLDVISLILLFFKRCPQYGQGGKDKEVKQVIMVFGSAGTFRAFRLPSVVPHSPLHCIQGAVF